MKIYKIKVNGKSYKVEVESVEEVKSDSPATITETKKEEPKRVSGGNVNEVPSPIQGSVTDVKVKVGDVVKKGQTLLIIEAMKLENEVVSPFDGEVAEVLVSKGQNVTAKEVVITIK